MMKKTLNLFIWSLLLCLGAETAFAQDGIQILDMPKQRKPAKTEAKQPLTIIFVCDRSGSMEDYDKIDELNTALESFFRDLYKNQNLATNLHVGIVDFASNVNVSRNPSPLGLRDHAPSFHAHGGTNMDYALDKAYSLAKRVPTGQLKPIVMLLTDGEPDSKGKTRRSAQNVRNIAHLYTLGVSGADFAFLEEIAGDPNQSATLKGTQFQNFFQDMSAALNYHIMSAQKNGVAPRTFSIQNTTGWKLH